MSDIPQHTRNMLMSGSKMRIAHSSSSALALAARLAGPIFTAAEIV